jgi:hypothetical protein
MRVEIGLWVALAACLVSCVEGREVEGGDEVDGPAPQAQPASASPPPMPACGETWPECGGACPAGESCFQHDDRYCFCFESGPAEPPEAPAVPPTGLPTDPPTEPPLDPVGVPCGESPYPQCGGTCEYDHQSCQAFVVTAGAGGAGQGECLCAGAGPGMNLPAIP